MTKKDMYIYSFFFAFLIVMANYTVQFPINDWLTYGAILYPFTFLVTDILSEKYSKEEVVKVVKFGSILAVIPTIIVSDYRIAFASIITFFLVQRLDVVSFHYLKRKYPSKWWLRNNLSTISSQFIDTTLFFFLAFSFVMPVEIIVKLIIGDYLVKIVFALLDTPIFYLFAIKVKNKIAGSK